MKVLLKPCSTRLTKKRTLKSILVKHFRSCQKKVSEKRKVIKQSEKNRLRKIKEHLIFGEITLAPFFFFFICFSYFLPFEYNSERKPNDN